MAKTKTATTLALPGEEKPVLPTNDRDIRGVSEYIEVENLSTDSSFNRPLNMARVQKIADEFDPDAFGALIISSRNDGRKVILDGQHRAAAVLYMQWKGQKLPCYVYYGLTIEREAELFAVMNGDRVRPLPYDLFKARVVAKNEDAVAVNNAVEALGLHVSDHAGPNNLMSSTTIEKIYNVGGVDLLQKTLSTLKEAWPLPESRERFGSEMLTGIAVFYAKFPQAKQEYLVRSLKKEQPSDVLAKARIIRTRGWRLGATIAYLCIDMHNYRLTAASRIPTISPTEIQRTFRRNAK